MGRSRRFNGGVPRFSFNIPTQEILVGARREADYREYHEDWVAPFEDLGRVITHSHTTWTRAARIVATLVERGRLRPGGFTVAF